MREKQIKILVRKQTVKCSYCGQQAELIDSGSIGLKLGLIWNCAPCSAYTLANMNSSTYSPIGTLAKEELRELRRKAQSAFDKLYKYGDLKKYEAVEFVVNKLGIKKSEFDINKFDLKTCGDTYDICLREWLGEQVDNNR